MPRGGWRGVAVAMVAFVMVASHGAGARAQSLQESLSFMIEDHKRIRAAESDLASARNTAISSLGSWFPTLDATALYGLEEQRKPDAVDTRFYPRQVDFTLTQLLWDFGAVNGTIRAAKRTYDQAQATLASTPISIEPRLNTRSCWAMSRDTCGRRTQRRSKPATLRPIHPILPEATFAGSKARWSPMASWRRGRAG